jgi:hypothetical protein
MTQTPDGRAKTEAYSILSQLDDVDRFGVMVRAGIPTAVISAQSGDSRPRSVLECIRSLLSDHANGACNVSRILADILAYIQGADAAKTVILLDV